MKLKKSELKLNYIGPLSRMQKKETPKQYDLMILLSGPEPQRGLLEEQLKNEVVNYTGKVVFIKGIVEKDQEKEQIDHVTYYNFMNTRQLEQTFNESDVVLCRSGYTTIMDLVQLEKKAFFIPTPGQYEQEYLAKKMKRDGWISYKTQEKFKIQNLQGLDLYKGLPKWKNNLDWKILFEIFEKH